MLEREEVRALLEAVVLVVPCNVCGQDLEVTLGQVAGSHDALCAGCLARGGSECPAMAYARLLDRETIEGLATAWARLQEHARRAGGRVLIRALSEGV
ncbi:hypothetical protein HRbin24_01592 [bacterium HR24]|nr:hypothetical protein HRbin24_01592 [bacterium HR24]